MRNPTTLLDWARMGLARAQQRETWLSSILYTASRSRGWTNFICPDVLRQVDPSRYLRSDVRKKRDLHGFR